MTAQDDDETKRATFQPTGLAKKSQAPQQAPPQPAALPPAPARPDGESTLLSGGVLDGRYRLVDKLGQGGMGSVFLVDDLLLRRKVALKTLRLDAVDGPDDLDRFRKEAAITHAINHPNVARTYDIGEENGVHYMSMEWLAGETLMDRIRAKGKLPPEEVRHLALALCLGLRAAHRAGIVHRDLKPANIMLVPEERGVVVMDFGIAASVSESRGTLLLPSATRSQEGIDSPWEVTSAGRGTPAYMAPEQWDGAQGDARTDIYALGVILYVGLTASAPFRGKTTAELAQHHRTKPAPDVRAEAPTVDRDLALLIRRCLAKAPDERPRDMDEVLDVLRRSDRRRAWLGALAVTALLTVAGTVALDAAVYQIVSSAVLREMRPGLSRLAQLVAMELPADRLTRIRTKADMAGPDFAAVHATLSAAKSANPDIKGLYVLRATDAKDVFRFVADERPVDRDEDGDGSISDREKGAPTGSPYDGTAYPAMQRTLDTQLAQTDEAFAVDAWGVSLSGYAPVRIQGGRSDMFVGVDAGNAQLTALRARLHGVLGVVAALLVLGFAVVTYPLAGGQTLWRRLMRRPAMADGS